MPASFPPNTPIVWAVGTANRAKLESVHTAAKKVFPNNLNVLFSYTVKSGVSEQPMSATETQTGAVNRAVAALEAGMSATGAGAEHGERDPSAVEGSHRLCYADSQNARQGFDTDGEGAAATAMTLPMVHFGVGLEGGVEQVGDKFFECGWMAVAENPANPYLTHITADTAVPSTDAAGPGNAAAHRAKGACRIGIGSSARFEMSPVLMGKILGEGKELAEVIDELTGKTDVRSNLGAMGVLTAGHLGRAAAYEHGMLFALAPFLSDDKFWKA